MAALPKPASLDLGVVIAFVAPGFVAFLALSYHMPTARAWLDAASVSDQGVGVFLFVLLASLSIGLVVSGVRALVIDNVLRWRALGRFVVPTYTVDWRQIDEQKLTVLITVRDAYYRFYQFYANTLVALLFWTFSRVYVDGPSLPWPMWILVLAVLGTLLSSARDALSSYANAVNDLQK